VAAVWAASLAKIWARGAVCVTIGPMSKRVWTWLRALTAAGVGGFVTIWFLSGAIAAHYLCSNDKWDIGTWSPACERPVDDVMIVAPDGVAVSAWYVDAGSDRAVIWASGIGANRRNGLRHADYYLANGFSVVLVDLRGTGQSDRVPVSLGWHERHDLAAAKEWLHERGYEHVGAHGHSLGAATIAYSLQEVDDYAFIALESAYDTIQSALDNRLAMFSVPRFLGWPTTFFTQWYANVRTRDLQPVEHIRRSRVPTLILAGDAEPELPVRDTLAIYEACEAPLKRLHLFEGHAHVNHYRRAPEEWEALMNTFLIEAGMLPDSVGVELARFE
jgi:alpha-beta hydrolase superfamily lysophospholipase